MSKRPTRLHRRERGTPEPEIVQPRITYTYHQDGDVPDPESGSIFVFGSNLAGLHGLGAALVAKHMYGAEQGTGQGLTGSAYAIPTKDRWLRSRTLYEIKRSIGEFVRFTHEHPNLKFFVTRVGCGLAGYHDADISVMFRGANTNCSFAKQWRKYLQ